MTGTILNNNFIPGQRQAVLSKMWHALYGNGYTIRPESASEWMARCFIAPPKMPVFLATRRFVYNRNDTLGQKIIKLVIVILSIGLIPTVSVLYDVTHKEFHSPDWADTIRSYVEVPLSPILSLRKKVHKFCVDNPLVAVVPVGLVTILLANPNYYMPISNALGKFILKKFGVESLLKVYEVNVEILKKLPYINVIANKFFSPEMNALQTWWPTLLYPVAKPLVVGTVSIIGRGIKNNTPRRVKVVAGYLHRITLGTLRRYVPYWIRKSTSTIATYGFSTVFPLHINHVIYNNIIKLQERVTWLMGVAGIPPMMQLFSSAQQQLMAASQQ